MKRSKVHRTVVHEHTSRLTSFSDGVFAIATTLLVINLGISKTAPLATQLVALSDSLTSFVISFFVVAALWVSHTRLFHHIERYDDNMLWLNNVLLFFIALLPFSTLVIASFGKSSLAVAIYAASMALASGTYWLLWRYASKHQYLDEHVDKAEQERYTRRALGGTIIFAVSMPVAFFSVIAARGLWVLAILVYLFFDYIYHGESLVEVD